ncbi:MAG: peptidoglycan DD-metalloendopeptidase family protein [Bacteroidia bacterium]|nr:peptidoglycan DD-metalloendopeptidase family protein [Bacteroidia bacterium]
MEPNQYLTDVLTAHQVSPSAIAEAESKALSVFDLRQMRAGNIFTIIKNDRQQVVYFIYEKNAAEYIVIDFRDSIQVYADKNQVITRQREAAGTVQGTLFETIAANGLDVRLAKLMETAFACSVDFFHLKEGDTFKVIYLEDYVDEYPVGVSGILAAYFRHAGESYYAFRFDQPEGVPHYFDENGKSLNKAFLKAPLKYAGTDPRYQKLAGKPAGRATRPFPGMKYAAPLGTPVVATGDGIVTVVEFTARGGYEIQVRHSGVYTTQYLYLDEIAAGLKPGARVFQGDEIGYTGRQYSYILYKIWQNGRSVPPDAVNLPDTDPVTPENKEKFDEMRLQMTRRLSQAGFPQHSLALN